MISIIICSRTADISQELKDNISTTIGCDYELCVIDNSRGDYNIFSAYNEGVRRAKGDILCFMHEDVRFHSEYWGGVIDEAYSQDDKMGAIGVVGGQFVPNTPSSYWEGGALVGMLIQGYTNEMGQYKTRIDGKKLTARTTEVVAVDGLFICIPKTLFDKKIISWDEQTFHGFHCYDMDICYQIVTQGLKVCIVSDVLIEHFSPGNTDSVYCYWSQKLYDKWQDSFPLVRGREMSPKAIQERTQMVEAIRANLLLYNKAQDKYDNVCMSKAYRLGKALLKPLKWLKRK